MSFRSYVPSFPSVLFALVVVSVISSKVLHIFHHIQSLPFLYFVVYSPTLVIQDVVVISVSRLLLNSPESRWQWLACSAGAILA